MTTDWRAAPDFGLTQLTRRFHQDWTREGTALEIVASSAESFGGKAAPALLEDSLRLLESPLPTWAVTSLWLAATCRGYDIDRLGVDGRDWLRQIIDVCLQRLRKDDPAYHPPAPAPPSESLTGEVLDEILLVTPQLPVAITEHGWARVGGVVPALNLAATQAGPDLAFRLLLRCLSEYWVPLTQPQYDRFAALGERFGYGEPLVMAVDHLIDLE
ncbi:hypothetical protein AB0N07_44270 [Streptomyces sp. NPDC051172]|uniref:hypothetical protein n=1 Tax=Streptomyces sp. NPDC051172 TaxID=3155796 RepID=UPI003411FC85